MIIFANVGITGKMVRILPWAILKQKPQSYVPRLSGDYIPPATNSLSVSQRTLHQSPYTINHQREELCSDTLAQSLLLYNKYPFLQKICFPIFPYHLPIEDIIHIPTFCNFCKFLQICRTFAENQKRSSNDENE